MSAVFDKIRAFTEDAGDVLPHTSLFAVVPAFSFPATFSAADYPGLLLCHLVRRGTEAKLVAYWKDEAFFRAYAVPFRAALGLSDPEIEGPAVDLKRQRRGFWRRYSMTAWILTFAAVLGALSAMRDYFSVLFAIPKVEISYASQGPLHAVADLPMTIPLTVLSEVRFATMKITFGEPQIQASGKTQRQRLGLEIPPVPALGAGQSTRIAAEGTAPAHGDTQEAPDVYDLFIDATAEAGIWWFSLPVEMRKKELWVWHNRVANAPLAVSSALGNDCVLDGAVYIPRAYPQGLAGEVRLVSRPDEITGMQVAAPGGVDYTPSPPESTRTAWKMKFRTPPSEAFRKYSYRVLVSARAATMIDCQRWAKNTQASFE